ncbi:UNVERIFIED_CONTAM: hypothetical protein K2H54_040953 [Gekko kuhli]
MWLSYTSNVFGIRKCSLEMQFHNCQPSKHNKQGSLVGTLASSTCMQWTAYYLTLFKYPMKSRTALCKSQPTFYCIMGPWDGYARHDNSLLFSLVGGRIMQSLFRSRHPHCPGTILKEFLFSPFPDEPCDLPLI